jgi:hypothetical protein
VFKSGAILEQSQSAKFRYEQDYGAGFKLPKPYETFSLKRVIQPPEMEYAGVKVSAPKEIVRVPNVKVYEGTYTSKVLQSKVGTQKFDVSTSRGELSSLQAKRGEGYYGFGEAIEKNAGQTYEFSVSKFRKGKAIDLTPQTIKRLPTKERFEIVTEETQNIDYLTGDRTVYDITGKKLYKGQFQKTKPFIEEPTPELLVKEPLPSQRVVYNLKGEPIYRGKFPETLSGESKIVNLAPAPKPVPTQQPIEAGKPLSSQVNIREPVIIREAPVKVGATAVAEGQTVMITRTAQPEVMIHPAEINAVLGGAFKEAQGKILVGRFAQRLNVNTLPKSYLLSRESTRTDVTLMTQAKAIQNIGQIQEPTAIQELRVDLLPRTSTITKPVSRTEMRLETMTMTGTRTITQTLTQPTQTLTQPRVKTPEPQQPVIFKPSIPNIESNVKKTREKGRAYIVQLKRKGKFYKVSSPLEKPQALDVLAMKLSRTLGATARIVPVNQAPVEAQTTGEFARLKGTFRDYRIQKGQRIPLENTYIQEAKFRLGSREERTEIQSSKRMFGKIFGGFKQ